jgi:hypothetical protein
VETHAKEERKRKAEEVKVQKAALQHSSTDVQQDGVSSSSSAAIMGKKNKVC